MGITGTLVAAGMLDTAATLGTVSALGTVASLGTLAAPGRPFARIIYRPLPYTVVCGLHGVRRGLLRGGWGRVA